MTMREMSATDVLGLERGSAAVCIPIAASDRRGAAGERAAASASSVLAHTDRATPVVIAGTGASVEEVAGRLSGEAEDRRTLGLACESGTGEAQAVNRAARASFPGDLVVVAAGVRVADGWLERLRAAAFSDSTVASATPLSLGAGAVELEGSEDPAQDIEQRARSVGERAQPLLPRIASVGPGCVYIRRPALELTGPLDESLPLEAALARWATRAIAAGMVHVGADDVLVAGVADAPASRDEAGSGADGRVRETLLDDERGRLRRAVRVARMTLQGLSVTIDGRALTAAVGGTQTYIIELILALARERDVAVRVLVAPDLSERAASALAAFPEVELLTYEQALAGAPLTDVVHRPQSVFTPDDLTLLRMVGERVIVGQLDLIAYHNYAYHSDVEHWRAYRRTTRLALGGADQVIFFSEHARRDALAEDLVPEQRTHVVGVGAEVLEPAAAPAARPEGIAADEPFLLCLGADYAHKNRPFAVELLGALRDLGWVGRLVLAGAHVPLGSSRERERSLLERRPDLAQLVVDLGPVPEPGKQWLLAHARALVYPTIYEGFGLLPLEAARAGIPCLFAAQASLSELAGEAAVLVPWDARASAAAVLALLAEGSARDEHLARLRELSTPSWGEAARRLVSVYRHAVEAPPSEAAPRIWQELERESYMVGLERDIRTLKATAEEYQDAYHALSARVQTGLPLIDRGGGLLDEVQQRGLMRIAARRGLGAVLLAPLGLLGRWPASDGASAQAARAGADRGADQSAHGGADRGADRSAHGGADRGDG